MLLESQVGGAIIKNRKVRYATMNSSVYAICYSDCCVVHYSLKLHQHHNCFAVVTDCYKSTL